MPVSTPLSSLCGRRADAVAFIRGSDRYRTVHGRVLFYATRAGVILYTEVSGLPTATGPCDSPIFACHIHSGGRCAGTEQDAFADAGTHDNPHDCPHPYHAGDLPPLFSAGGQALSLCLTDRFTLPEILGKTVIIHRSPDDFTTQPSGNSGEKIACGVIAPSIRYRRI